MRGATECAKRLKGFFSKLRAKVGKVPALPVGNPVSQLILGVLSRDTQENKASVGLDRLRAIVVDYNELRVIPPIELAELLHDFADARRKCEDIARALNAVFAIEHTVALDHLVEVSRRDTLAYLEKIEGLEAYTIARIRLLGLRQHAIPLDEAMWAVVREEEVVNSRCPLDEAQQFLERQIAPEQAQEFVALLKKHAWAEKATAVRKRDVEPITSVPPDRSTRNMLQLVSMGGTVTAGGAATVDKEEAAEPAAPASKSRAKTTSKTKPAAKTKAKPAAKKTARKISAAKPVAKKSTRKTAAAKPKKKKATSKTRPQTSTGKAKSRRTARRSERARAA